LARLLGCSCWIAGAPIQGHSNRTFDTKTFRAERSLEQVCSEEQYARVFNRMNALRLGVDHLIVQLGDVNPTRRLFSSSGTNNNTGIPIAYPRMTFLETALSTRLNPLVALSKTETFGLRGFRNNFNGDAELLDDLVLYFFHLSRPGADFLLKNDQWTSKHHMVLIFCTVLYYDFQLI
jgi:hypothetical protein